MIDLFENQTDNLLVDDGEIDFLTPMDVAKMMHCSIPTARQFFYRPDFPAIKVGKNLKVMKSAFVKWASQRRMDWKSASYVLK